MVNRGRGTKMTKEPWVSRSVKGGILKGGKGSEKGKKNADL